MLAKFGPRTYGTGKVYFQSNTTFYLGFERQVQLHSNVGEKSLEPPSRMNETFPKRLVQIQTCGKLYEKWRKERRYWYVHDGDHDFNVPYIDTGSDTQDTQIKTSPVVVEIHGSPGSCEMFSPITSHLHGIGARVIAPSLPDLKTKAFKDFRHSAEEKQEYVKDFLKAINISKVDLLICHSSALFPGLLMCLENQCPEIGSLCLLNPTAFDYPRTMQPYILVASIARMYEFPVGRGITKLIGQLLVKSRKQLKEGNYLDHFLSAFSLVFSNIPQGAYHFQELLGRNLPVFLAYSENDKLIDKTSSMKMARMMVQESEIHKYDSQGRLTTPGEANPYRRVLCFEKGTHFLFVKYPEQVSDALTTFLFQNLDSHQSSK